MYARIIIEKVRANISVLLLILFASLISPDVFSQIAEKDTLAASKSLKNAIDYYHSSTGSRSILYSGVRHEGYTADIQGTAYFMSEEWQNGQVYFDNVLFDNVPLLYDELKDELLTQLPGSQTAISLVGERVGRFAIGGHTFIRLTSKDNSLGGFYDVLTGDQTKVLVKRKKAINENTSREGVKKRFLSNDRYYLRKDGDYFAIRNIKDVLDVLSDRRNEIKLLIKNRKLDMKTDPENTLQEIAAHYDKLKASI